ncbi:MAG: glycosyltransferase family 4 protein [Planctomycetota bacterium]
MDHGATPSRRTEAEREALGGDGARAGIRADAVAAAEVVARHGIDERTGERLRVVLINQYYTPDVAATAHLMHELAAELVRQGFEVEVLSSRPSYGPKATWVDCPTRETLDGVSVVRMWTTRFSKDNLIGRLINFATFLTQLVARALLGSRRDTVYLYTTSPPFLGLIGAWVSLVRKHRYLTLLYDSYPQIASWVGTIRRRGLAERLWHAMNRFYYRRSEGAIVLCQKARSLVCDTYGVSPERVHVIPNWADSDVLAVRPKAESMFAARHRLLDHFVVMYSGNLGLYYEFETTLDAAERLWDAPFRLVLVGAGGRRGWLKDQIVERELTNTLLLQYQKAELLADSLGAADASLVTIAEGIEGISFPSKLYSSLAVGRPILALSEADSELRELVEKHRVGLWCEIGDVDRLEASIRWLMEHPQKAERMGGRARRLFERAFTKEIAAERYGRVLRASHPLITDPAGGLTLDSIEGGAEVEAGEADIATDVP